MKRLRLSSFAGFLLSVLLFTTSFNGFLTKAAGEGEGRELPYGSKIIKAVYFNQWIEPNGSKYPAEGWRMCGAASGVIALSAYNKPITLNYNDHDFKVFMYKDTFIDGTGTPICGYNKGGAFTLTNTGCTQSYAGGIQNYLKKYGRYTTYTTYKTFSFVKQAIDRGHPVIFNFRDSTDSSFGHIATIVGYTPSGKIIVNDTYTNVQIYGRGWRTYYTGKLAVYDLFSTRWPIGYLMEVY